MTDLTKAGLGMADDKTPDDVGPDEATLPSVPLDDLEGKPKGRTAQLLSVLISGVALFSDGYNIQVTGKFSPYIQCQAHLSLYQYCSHGAVPGSDDNRDENPLDQFVAHR
jgi:hypothetical protein